MSTTVMGLCWPLQMPASAKSVLMSLADNANDRAEAWQQALPTICMRTCLGRTAVIDAIKYLEAHGVLTTVRKSGRGNMYQLHPERLDQSVSRTSPFPGLVCEADGTSPAGGRDQSGRRTGPVRQADPQRNKPSKVNKSNTPSRERTRRTRISLKDLPPAVSPELAKELISYRRTNARAPLTQRAFNAIVSELDRAQRELGVSAERALTEMQVAGWRCFKVEWLRKRLSSMEGDNDGKAGKSSAVASVVEAGRRRISQRGEAYAWGTEPFGDL